MKPDAGDTGAPMSEHISQTVYFARPGQANTTRVLEIASARAHRSGQDYERRMR